MVYTINKYVSDCSDERLRQLSYEIAAASAGGACYDVAVNGKRRDFAMARRLKQWQANVPAAVAELAEELTAGGYKVTEPRLAVLEGAVALEGTFTAVALEAWLGQRGWSPGQASIFRTLKLLTELGMLHRIHGVDECHRYTLSRGHAHRVVCTGCGRLAEFDECGIDELRSRLEQATGFRIESHLLEFFGECPQCRSSAA